MKLSFLGATQTVTGSRYLLTCGERRVLIDCGLFQGFKHLRLKNWSRLPVDTHGLGAVLLTHAHLDHSGYLPVVLDKTGTITVGKPAYDRTITANGFSEQQILRWAAGLDRASEHPLARAVVAGAEAHGVNAASVTDFESVAGQARRRQRGIDRRQAPTDVAGSNEPTRRRGEVTMDSPNAVQRLTVLSASVCWTTSTALNSSKPKGSESSSSRSTAR